MAHRNGAGANAAVPALFQLDGALRNIRKIGTLIETLTEAE
jgi:hypothetical protein